MRLGIVTGRMWRLILIILCLRWPFLGSGAEKVAPIKLAIVDAGRDAKVPPVFLDLLMTELAKHSNVALLERQQIDKLLREHTLALAMTGRLDRKTAVQVGRLWTVDVFLMLEADNKTNNDLLLRIRLVDARHGLRLWDSNLLLSGNRGTRPDELKNLAQKVHQKLAPVAMGNSRLSLVGIAAFRSEEITPKWDWLAETLAVNIEQCLGLLPGVIVTERKTTEPLTNERLLTSELPDVLQASQVIVDGSFRLQRDKGADSVLVRVRCRRDKATLLDITLEGSLHDLVSIYQRATQAVATQVTSESAFCSMDAMMEAQMLVAETAAYLQNREHSDRALSLAEAAYSLCPDDTRYALTALRAITARLTEFQYAFDPQKQLCVRKRDDILDRTIGKQSDFIGCYLKHSDGHILVGTTSHCILADQEMNAICASSVQDINSWPRSLMELVRNYMLCVCANKLCILQKVERYRTYALLSVIDDPSMSDISRDAPIHDLLSTPNGLLILTDRTLWRIPELKGRSPNSKVDGSRTP